MNDKIYSWIYKTGPGKDTLNYIMNPMSAFVENQLSKYYLLDTIAHNYMLYKQNIVPKNISKKILSSLLDFYDNYDTFFSPDLWDIHENCEKKLYFKIWDDAWWFHVGRSRNDQVTTDQKLFIKESVLEIMTDLNLLTTNLKNKSEENINVIMPWYTHLRIWTHSSFWFWFQSYLVQILENINILKETYDITDVSPLWAGNSYWVNWPLDTKMTTSDLGFSKQLLNSLSMINSRWIYELQILSPLLNIMLIISRMMEDIIIWSTDEFWYIKLWEKYTTWSSIMPQKMNPDVAEKLRSKISIVVASFNQIILSLKGTPSWYNRDSADTKIAIVNSLNEVKDSISIVSKMIETIEPQEKNMKKFLMPAFATKLADYLSYSFKIPFRLSHKIVGGAILEVWNQVEKLDFKIVNKLILKYWFTDFKITKNEFDKIFSIENALLEYKYLWTANPKYVQEVNEELEKNIGINRKWFDVKSNNYNESHKELLMKVKNMILS